MTESRAGRRRSRCLVIGAACGLLGIVGPSSAQPPRIARPNIVVGHAVDESGASLAHVRVTVAASFIEAESDAWGVFRLPLPAGVWEVKGRLLGFHPDSHRVVVTIDRPTDTVRLTLRRAINELRAITVNADAASPMAVSATAENVRQLPALGEPDLLRVLPFLPGVHQTNDLRSALYLAGSASDEAAMRLDGFRLQWPTHLNGIFGALDVAALDHADVLIHHLPASSDGAIGGLVDFWPRLAGDRPTLDAGVSLLSASATTTAETPGRAVQVLASGRATYAEQAVSRVVGRDRARASDALPPSFQDWLGRLSAGTGDQFSASLISYGTSDERPRTSADGSPVSWGETLTGMHAAWAGAVWRLEGQASTDEASLAFREPGDSSRRIDIRHTWNSTMLQLRRAGDRTRATLGIAADARRNVDRWNTSTADRTVAAVVPFHYDSTSSQQVLAAFAEAEFDAGAGVTANVGARGSWLGTEVYVAPRVLVSRALAPEWRVSVAVDRRHQFDAQIEPVGDQSVAQPAFLLAKARSVDAAAVSAVWHSMPSARDDARRVEITTYLRRYPDRTIAQRPNLRDTVDHSFPTFQRVRGGARGLSLGGTISTTRDFVLQGAYTYQSAWNDSGGQRIPADWDIRHSLALFSALPVVAGWTLTAAGQVRSGFPITPVALRVLVPEIGGTGNYTTRFSYDQPNSARIPGFRRFDLGVRRSWRGVGADWTFSAQAVNVLARSNPVSYDWRIYFDELASSGVPLTSHSGLPFVPSIGLTVHW